LNYYLLPFVKFHGPPPFFMRKNIETIIEVIVNLVAIGVGIMILSFAGLFMWTIITSILK